jgi:hypothetical protein
VLGWSHLFQGWCVARVWGSRRNLLLFPHKLTAYQDALNPSVFPGDNIWPVGVPGSLEMIDDTCRCIRVRCTSRVLQTCSILVGVFTPRAFESNYARHCWLWWRRMHASCFYGWCHPLEAFQVAHAPPCVATHAATHTVTQCAFSNFRKRRRHHVGTACFWGSLTQHWSSVSNHAVEGVNTAWSDSTMLSRPSSRSNADDTASKAMWTLLWSGGLTFGCGLSVQFYRDPCIIKFWKALFYGCCPLHFLVHFIACGTPNLGVALKKWTTLWLHDLNTQYTDPDPLGPSK